MTDTQTPERIVPETSKEVVERYASLLDDCELKSAQPFCAALLRALVAERDQLKAKATHFENASKALIEICDSRQREIDSLKRKFGYE